MGGFFSVFKSMAMGSHKVDLGNFQCPNGQCDLHQLKLFFMDIQFIVMQNLCILYAYVVKIIFNWPLTISGRVLVRLRGGVKINRLCKKRKRFKTFKN